MHSYVHVYIFFCFWTKYAQSYSSVFDDGSYDTVDLGDDFMDPSIASNDLADPPMVPNNLDDLFATSDNPVDRVAQNSIDDPTATYTDLDNLPPGQDIPPNTDQTSDLLADAKKYCLSLSEDSNMDGQDSRPRREL